MSRTNISWATHVWNPTIGCTHVSPGCENCYAEAFAWRLARMGKEGYPDVADRHGWTGEVMVVSKRLAERFPAGSRVFVGSMTDLFHERVIEDTLVRVFEIMQAQPLVTFCVLTKRSWRMSRWVTRFYGEEPPPNIWFGVSVENQKYADLRISHLRLIPAAVKFVSFEPLLEDIRIRPDWIADIDWAIVGGESGPKRRPFDVAWAVALYEQCREGGVKVFGKQTGGLSPGEPLVLPGYGVVQEWPWEA